MTNPATSPAANPAPSPQPDGLPLPCPTDLEAVRAWLDATSPDPAVVRAWAAPMLAAADQHGETPRLGSPAWRALPDSDPRKLATVVHAALARLADTVPAAIAERLELELNETNRLALDRIRHASWDVAAAWSELHHDGPTHAELTERRNTFPCLTCQHEPVIHPQTTCHTCQQQRPAPSTTAA